MVGQYSMGKFIDKLEFSVDEMEYSGVCGWIGELCGWAWNIPGSEVWKGGEVYSVDQQECSLWLT